MTVENEYNYLIEKKTAKLVDEHLKMFINPSSHRSVNKNRSR
jgi:hypothetical protein